MTNDLTAIRAELSDGAYPIGWGHATIISLCDETERLRAENERLTREASYHQQELNSLLKRSRIRQDRAEKAEAAARAENERLRAALKPFADEAAYWFCHNYTREDRPVEGFSGYQPVMTCGDLFNARAALGQEGDA